jgi:hypothetical protein
MDRKDLLDIIQSVQEGKQLSDFVVVAIHVSSFAFQAYSHDNSNKKLTCSDCHRLALLAVPQARLRRRAG